MLVELCQQLLPRRETRRRQSVARLNGFNFDILFLQRLIDDKAVVFRAEKPGQLSVQNGAVAAPHQRTDANPTGQAVLPRSNGIEDGSERGKVIIRRWKIGLWRSRRMFVPRVGRQAGSHMVGILVRHRTYDRQLVHDKCRPRQQLGKTDAGQACCDVTKLSAHRCGTVRFGIKRLLLRMTAVQVKHDDLFRATERPARFIVCRRALTQQLWQRQAKAT